MRRTGNNYSNEDNIRLHESCHSLHSWYLKQRSRLLGWMSLLSLDQEEYCNSYNLQLLQQQQQSNGVVLFCSNWLGHMFGRSWFIITTIMSTYIQSKWLQARRDKLVQQQGLRDERDDLERSQQARRQVFEQLREQRHCQFQRELQQLQDNNLLLNNTWNCRLPSCALLDPAFADDNSINEFYQWLGHALVQNTSLQHLILDGIILTIAPTTTTTLSILANGISQSKVETLTIKQNTQLSQAIRTLFPTNQTKHHYMGQFLSDLLVSSKLSSLTKLALVGADLRDVDEMTLLAQGLSSNMSLTSLVMESCEVVDLQILFSPQGLWKNLSLSYLQLKKCHIGDFGVTVLVEHWPPESLIQTLSLPLNGIGPRGAQLLVLGAAHNHPALRALDLSCNCDIGYEGLRMIGDDLPNQPYLTSLELFACATSSAYYTMQGNQRVFEHVPPVTRDQAGHALVQGVRTNLCIQQVNVFGNFFPCDVEAEIDFYASRNRIGGHLLSNDFKLPASCWSNVLAKCQRHPYSCFGPSFVFFFLREHPNLVPNGAL